MSTVLSNLFFKSKQLMLINHLVLFLSNILVHIIPGRKGMTMTDKFLFNGIISIRGKFMKFIKLLFIVHVKE